MAEMDVLQSKIIHQIEVYLTEDNLRNDYNLAKYEQENQGWIPVERLNHFNKLSTYKYDTILNALRSKRSNIIELDLSEPVCVRRRRLPLVTGLAQQNPNLHRTVVVNGLPRDVKHEELFAFFTRFYPIEQIKMLPSLRAVNSFAGKIHLIFVKCQDALDFVQRSESMSIIYVNDYVLQLCNGYTLVCKMLADCDDQDENDLIKQSDQLRFSSEQTMSQRPRNSSPRVSFNTKISSSKNEHVRRKLPSISQTKSCLKSSTCATEQILFCQNPIDNKLSKVLEYDNQPLVSKRFSYEYYIPDHLLKQTHECMIIAALNPHCFTIQLKQDAIEFDKFQREVNDFYNENDDRKYFVRAEEIQINLCVICADPKASDDDKIWNRSQILDYDPLEKTVNLFYVDLGTWDEYVPINRLRHLNDYFHRHLVFSLTCRLAHISPINGNTWSTDAIEQFLAVIDQALPECELLTFDNDGCFQTNLFVINSGQYVCVNDYMIHIKKATPIVQSTNLDDTDRDRIQSNKNDHATVHPVTALYNQLGETLKRSYSSGHLVKLIHLSTQTTPQEKLSLIFIHYQKTILLPDFNICNLLTTITSNIDIDTLEAYASAIKCRPIPITREHHPDLFAQLESSIHSLPSNSIALYTIDFVRYILERHQFRVTNVFLALEQAKYAQLYTSDLSLWFQSDSSTNSVNRSVPKTSTDEQNSSIKKRLPFSNRLISRN